MDRRILSRLDFRHQPNVVQGVNGTPELSVVSQYEVPTLHVVMIDKDIPIDFKFAAKETFASVAPDSNSNYIITLSKPPLYDSSKDIKKQFIVKDGAGNTYTPASFDASNNQLTLAETGTNALSNVSVWYYAPKGIFTFSVLLSSGGHNVEVNLLEDSVLSYNQRNAFSSKTAVYLDPYPAVEYMKLALKVKSDYLIDMSSELSVINLPVVIGYASEFGIDPDDIVRYYVDGKYREFPPSMFV